MSRYTRTMDIGIIGGGVVGHILALSLLRRGINAKVYEKATDFKSVGAGIGIPISAQRCLQKLCPEIFANIDRAAGPPWDDFLTLLDGFNDNTSAEIPNHEDIWLQTGDGANLSFRPCHRAALMADLHSAMPEGAFLSQKRFLGYQENVGTGRLVLTFADGTETEVDAVIGCDGIKSQVRRLLFGKDNPISQAHYSQKFAYRAVVPMEKMVVAVGEQLAKTSAHRAGPGGHIVIYPVANNTLVNLVMYRTDPLPWPDSENMVLPGTRSECLDFYKGWNPVVRRIVSALGDNLDRWGMFDMAQHPAPYFNKGRVVIIGDAAHAATPHHACGAAFGIEDTLALVTILEELSNEMKGPAKFEQATLNARLTAAFNAFNTVRYERDIWLVRSAREAGDVYEWLGPGGQDGVRAAEDMRRRHSILGDFDVSKTIEQARVEYRKEVGRLTTQVGADLEKFQDLSDAVLSMTI